MDTLNTAALEQRPDLKLARLVEDPRWKKMLAYNPIRAEHEYAWYFQGRFPGRNRLFGRTDLERGPGPIRVGFGDVGFAIES